MPFGPNAINPGYGQTQNNPTGLSNEVIASNPAQTPGNFVITGGSIDGTPIGITTPAAAHFTTIDLNTPLAVADGGTGLSSTPTNGQLLIGNGGGFSINTLTAGAGMLITNSSGTITLQTTGGSGTVTSIDVSGGTTGLTYSGGPVTSSGTITMAGTLEIANGGTGATSDAAARSNLGVTATGADTTYAYRANNLSDLASAVTARTNLGLGTIATQNSSSVTLTGGTINSVVIGGSTASAGTFTVATATTRLVSPHLDAADSSGGALRNASSTEMASWGAGGGSNFTISVATNINPANSAVSISPTGTGSVTIAPSTIGSINNMTVGAVTPASGAFTSLSASGTTTLNGTAIPSSQTLVYSGGPLGTPSSGTLTNCTSLPVSTGISGLGTGVATALAVNVGSAGAPVVNGGALGTPSSGTLTNATGLPISTGVSGLGTGIATALAVNTGSAGAPVLFNGALGTPSSGTVTNLTGTASININGTVGATTPSTGAFTTLSASGGASTSGVFTTNDGTAGVRIAGTGGTNAMRLYGYSDATSGSVINALLNGATYIPLSLDASTVRILSSNSLVGAFSSTGLAVTGNGTFTQDIQLGNTYALSWGGTYAANYPTIVGSAGAEALRMYPKGAAGGIVGDFSTTGLAVTGTISATGYIVGAGTNPGGLGGSKYIMDWVTGSHRFFSMGADASTNGQWQWYSQRSDGSNSVIPMTLSSTGLAVTGTVKTSENVTWDFGAAATVSPTSPNRTIKVIVGGTTYYIAAKTTND